MGFFNKVVKKLGFDPNDRAIARYAKAAEKIDGYEAATAELTDEELEKSAELFRSRLKDGETLDDILPEVFARVREVSMRRLGLRHFKEQLIGGMALHEGNIAEMKTGEGKTLVATLAVVLEAMAGEGVHVVTVNDYLAKRDAEWMKPVYEGMGLTVGVIYPFMPESERYNAYRCDITYGTNSEFGFDYLKDNMADRKVLQVQRGHHFCIVDEVDSILIDEARTPLIISGPSDEETESYCLADVTARRLVKDRDFKVDEKERTLFLTDSGMSVAEGLMQITDLFSDFANSALSHKLIQALKAHHLFRKDVNYVVKDGEIIIVDEFTGRLMFGRRYSDGLHQAIEAKEHVQIGRENQTLATVTLQNYFRMYRKLAGMTGTAITEAEEFKEIYGLNVIVIPTHKPMIRNDNPDVVYRTVEEKYQAAANEVEESYKRGQPVLIGTASIEHSERMSSILSARKIPHNVLNAKVHDKEAAIIAQAGRFRAVTVATNMAGRGTDIALGGNPEFLAREDLIARGITPESDNYLSEWAEALGRFEAACKEEHKKVIELGGLRVIGTERHESRRIDNQLRGRSGRQGDPGESRFYISLEDDLIRLFGGDRIAPIMDKLGMEPGEAIEHNLLSKAIENAQKKVEEMHFDIRRQLLGYDDVMNQQREAVYKERETILTEDDDVLFRVLDILLDTAKFQVNTVSANKETPDIQELCSRLNNLFWSGLARHIEKAQCQDELEEMYPKVEEEIRQGFMLKVNQLGTTAAKEIFRYIILNVLDKNWKDHLLNMDELRKGIGLRAIGQKEPLVEYQFESFNLFQEMLERIREEITQLVLRVNIVQNEQNV